MTTRDRMAAEQEAKVESSEPAASAEAWKSGGGWDNGTYDPKRFSCLAGGQHIHDGLRSQLMPILYRYPLPGDTVQMVVENRDGPPLVRAFYIIEVLDKRIGLVNGMLFLADSDVRQANPSVAGFGMAQAVARCGFEVPNEARGVFWLRNVRFHPTGLPRQQTRTVEKCIGSIGDTDKTEYAKYEIVEEPLFDGDQPLLEATWRWPQ